MKIRDAEATKKRILETAEELFSVKGFSGTSVNEIVKSAGVNKALLYYYFESKDGLLEELFQQLTNDIEELMNNRLNRMAEYQDINSFKDTFDFFLDFVIEKRHLLKIAMVESMKIGNKPNVFFDLCQKVIEVEIKNIQKAYESKGMEFNFNRQEFLVNEFFTGIMPVITFVIYKDYWQKEFDIDDKDLRKYFINAYTKTHISGHFNK